MNRPLSKIFCCITPSEANYGAFLCNICCYGILATLTDQLIGQREPGASIKMPEQLPIARYEYLNLWTAGNASGVEKITARPSGECHSVKVESHH